MTSYDPKAAAARGAALLDERDPEWVAKMPEDLAELDVSKCTRCPLGYWAGDFDLGMRNLGISDPAEYGFDRPWRPGCDDIPWRLFKAAWQSEITVRRESVSA